MLVPGNNRSCTKAPIDEAVDDPYGILITETPEFIAVSTGNELNADHVVSGLVGKVYSSIDCRGTTSSGISNKFVINEELHEV